MGVFRTIIFLSTVVLLMATATVWGFSADAAPDVFEYTFDDVDPIKIYAGPVSFAHLVHASDYQIACDCRKGAPGMLLQAAEEHGISLQDSYMVGDKLADIEAGERAGCQSILVLTGYGEFIASKPEVAAVEQCPDLDCASRLILGISAINSMGSD